MNSEGDLECFWVRHFMAFFYTVLSLSLSRTARMMLGSLVVFDYVSIIVWQAAEVIQTVLAFVSVGLHC